MELRVDEGEGLQSRTEAAAGATDALGDGPHLAVPAGEQRDDAVRLAERMGAQDDRVVPIELLLHGAPSLRPTADGEDPAEGKHHAASVIGIRLPQELLVLRDEALPQRALEPLQERTGTGPADPLEDGIGSMQDVQVGGLPASAAQPRSCSARR